MTDIESPNPSESDIRSSMEVAWDAVPQLHGNRASNLRASLKGMATLCKQAASAHEQAAVKHGFRNNVLQVASILVASTASITATVAVFDEHWAGQLVVAILTSAAGTIQSIVSCLNLEGRKEKHIAVGHRYTCLARDIVVKLVSGSNEADYWEGLLKESQHHLDNILTVEPPLQ